jgi:hypothetical protein
MNIAQRLSLFWRRFSPLEERLIAAVREVLPAEAQALFDAQIAGITLVQRHPNEICFYRMVSGKANWSGIPTFPHTGEFRLAEVKFSVEGKRYKATLASIGGHIFDFTVLPGPKSVSFADWDAVPACRLLCDPMTVDSAREARPFPDSWREFLAQNHAVDTDGWKLHDSETAYSAAFTNGEFLILAERGGDQFVLHRIDPPASTLFYLDSHDGTPEPIKGEIPDVFRQSEIL